MTKHEIESLVVPHLKLWPFSPLAKCLPERLWATALVDRTLDVDGLVRWERDVDVLTPVAAPIH